MVGQTSSSMLPRQRCSTSGTDDSSKWKIQDTQQDTGLVPTIAVTLFLGWNGFVLWTILYAILLASRLQVMIIFGLFTLSVVLPVDFPGKLGYRIGGWMMRQSEKYFGESCPDEDCAN